VQDVVVRQNLEPGTRVTVKMGDTRPEPGENLYFLSLLCISLDPFSLFSAVASFSMVYVLSI